MNIKVKYETSRGKGVLVITYDSTEKYIIRKGDEVIDKSRTLRDAMYAVGYFLEQHACIHSYFDCVKE